MLCYHLEDFVHKKNNKMANLQRFFHSILHDVLEIKTEKPFTLCLSVQMILMITRFQTIT